MTANSVSIGILGATGYTGVELLRLVQDHPSVRVACMTSERYAGQPIAAVFPASRRPPRCRRSPRSRTSIPARSTWCSAACRTARRRTWCATLPRGPKVVDLSADFRLRDPELYERDLRPAAPRDRAPAGRRLRPDRARARGDPRDRSRRQPRLLPDHRAAAAAAAARGRPDRARPDHHRRQVGRDRRRPRRQGGVAAQRGQRGPARLRGRQPPPRAGDRAGPGGRRRARRSP